MDGVTFGDEENDDDNDVEKAMFVRKLTRRHHFNATVTNVPKNTTNSHSTFEVTTATSTSPTDNGSHRKHEPLIGQNRYSISHSFEINRCCN